MPKLYSAFRTEFHDFIQGTRVLEDREIRFSFRILAEDAPPQHGFSGITKYTGSLAAPEWEDVEPGKVFSFPGTLVKICSGSKDKFETLCHVMADISSAPYGSHFAPTGKQVYSRDYDVILLVGLTELKAQVSWIESRTVRAHYFLHVPVYLIQFSMCDSRGQRKGL